MRNRFQPWHLAVLVVLLGAVAVAVARWYPELKTYDAPRMLATLPSDHATLLYLDADALRKDGILDLLAGSKAVEEPEYRQFVGQTGFDYRTDLDGIAASFAPDGVYFLARGHFQWKRLTDYAAAQGGECRASVCNMPGSRPERNISFYPLQSDLLALAVSPAPAAALHIGPGKKADPSEPGSQPVWMSVSPDLFTRPDIFPDAARSLVSPLGQASKVTLAAGAKDKGIELRLEVTCATPKAAGDLAKQLSDATSLLKAAMERAKQAPDPRGFSGILTAGNFQQQQSQVIGTWPVERGFMEALANGQVQ